VRRRRTEGSRSRRRTLVPFAAYDDGGWERAWPEAEESTGITAIDDTPSVWGRRGERVPGSWWVWPASTGPAIQARVSGVEVVEAHCSKQLALRTNLPPVKIAHPFKFGVAIDTSIVRIGAVKNVPRSDASGLRPNAPCSPASRTWSLLRRSEAAHSCLQRNRRRHLGSLHCTVRPRLLAHRSISWPRNGTARLDLRRTRSATL
jgi:hypothetical protein